MKILLLNPNSSEETRSGIQKTAEKYAAGNYEVECINIMNSPPFLETYQDVAATSAGLVCTVLEQQSLCDGFVLACGYDPHLDLLKEVTDKPIVGIGEASLKVASMLGHKFSIICTDKHSIPMKEDQVRSYGMLPYLSSIRSISIKQGESEIEALLREAELSVEEDGAEVIVLSCAALSGKDEEISKKLNVPVLDGVKCAMIVAEGLVRCGLSISKIRKYSHYYVNA